MKLVITGGAGFVGSHVVEHFLKNTDWDVVVFDKLSYASNGLERLKEVMKNHDDKRLRIFTVNFSVPIGEGILKEIGPVDYILHLGGETHVDRSISDPEPFVMNNVVGTMHMLNWARNIPNLKRFHFMSTDEIFGPAPGQTAYKEWDRYKSCNPYAASKAGAEELCVAYANTYKMPIFITHTMNVFGERQHPEKFIPLCIRKAMNKEKIYIHSDPTRTIPGSRFWIHARNVAAALHFLLMDSVPGEKYNIVGEKEVDNLDIAKYVAYVLGKDLNYELVDFHSSRAGHDLRYGLNGEKMKTMGWELPKTFEESLTKTIDWYVKNPDWLQI
jgi:dTDP-glucose 4,6-dehydratase